jgi:hypothetical protein
MRNHQSARVIVLVLTMLAFVSLACGGIPLPKLRSGQAAQQPPTSESTQPPLVPGATGPVAQPSPIAAATEPVAQPLPATVLPLGTSSGATTNYKVGDVISYGDLTLVVLGWSVSPKDYRGFAADPGNKYVLVDLVLFNRSGRQLPVNLFGAKLRDVSGQEYTFNGPVPFDGEFNPGERARGQLPIQVPEASTGDFTVTFNPGGVAKPPSR